METHISDIIHVIHSQQRQFSCPARWGYHAAVNSCRHTFFGCTASKDRADKWGRVI
jgi:hypothetical protein